MKPVGHWTDRHLLTPWRDGGRSFADGLDCYGDACVEYARRGIDLPVHGAIVASDHEAAARQIEVDERDWITVGWRDDQARFVTAGSLAELDIVIMNSAARVNGRMMVGPWHLALMVDRTRMLNRDRAGCSVVNINLPTVHRRIVRVKRYRTLA